MWGTQQTFLEGVNNEKGRGGGIKEKEEQEEGSRKNNSSNNKVISRSEVHRVFEKEGATSCIKSY